MRTIPPQSLGLAAVILGATFGLASCSVSPEVPTVEPLEHTVSPTPAAPWGETRTTPAPRDGRSDLATETSAPVLSQPGAVIHSRPAPPVIRRSNAWQRLQPLYDRATRAGDRFEFARATQLYRQLRDSPWTPAAMRDRFHQAASSFASIGYRAKRVRRALDLGDYQRADRWLRRLSRAHPTIPVRALLRHRDNS